MIQFLNTEFYNNTVCTYLFVFLALVLSLGLRRVLSRYFATLLFKLVARTGKKLNRAAFISLIIQPLENFLVLFIGFVALDKINYPKFLDFKIYKVTFFQVLDSASSIALVVTFTWLCLRVIDFVAMILEEIAHKTQDQTESQLVIFFKDFFKLIIIIIGFLMILRFGFNKDIGNLVTGLSIVGAAIALATKESLENLIASFIIFFDRPFTVGDTVKVNNLTGAIEKIGLRSTRIRTEEKTYISVPNKQMVDSIVDNLSLRNQRKVVLHLEVSLVVKAAQLQLLVESLKKVLISEEVESSTIFLKETGKNAHIIEVEYFTTMRQNTAEFNQMRQDINIAFIAELEAQQLPLAAAPKDLVVISKQA